MTIANRIEKYKKLFNVLDSNELEIQLNIRKAILKKYEDIDIDKRSSIDYAVMKDTVEEIMATLELQKERKEVD